MTNVTTPPVASSTIAPAVRSENDRKQSDRTRSSYTAGPRLRLSVLGIIQGYHLYWENDQDAAIEQLLGEGFEFVIPEEVNMQSRTQSAIVADADVNSSRVSKFVGTKADGSPLRAYLMKCPDDVWEERMIANSHQADQWDAAIRAGAVANVEGRYNPKGYDIKLKN